MPSAEITAYKPTSKGTLTRCRPPQGCSHWSACRLCKTPLWPRNCARGGAVILGKTNLSEWAQLPLIRIHYICFLKGLYRECRKSSSIQTVVQGQKAATIRRCMSSNQEVCKNTTRPHIALLTPTFCVGLESSSRRSPHLLPQLPVDHNSSVLEK